ncbi:peptide chain release factor 2, partial [candidate division WWE3 bacterium CG_4_9_14_3_um_filter_34_6]
MTLIERAQKVKNSLNFDVLQNRVIEIEAKMSDSSFWQDQKNASKLSQELSELKKSIANIEMLDLLIEEGTEKELDEVVTDLEMVLYLSGKYDKNDAYLTLHAGAGGTEAMD